MWQLGDTIFAPLTGMGHQPVHITRVSGKNIRHIAQKLAGIAHFKPRYAHYRPLTCPIYGDIIDHALFIYYPAPHSLSGEDCLEIQTHGSPAINQRLTEALLSFTDCRLAERGEFLMRAFMNNKIDLTKAQAINDLIAAQSENQRVLALRNADGALYRHLHESQEQISQALSFCEAMLDFSDDDLPPSTMQEFQGLMQNIIDHYKTILADKRAMICRQGIEVALIGAPNVGKSTLFNALLQRQAAIVSPIAGTTRDRLEGQFTCGGFMIHLFDTAGIRPHSNDEIEQMGMNISQQTAGRVDIRIFMRDNQTDFIDQQPEPHDIFVYNKTDLSMPDNPNQDYIYLSLKNNQNLDQLSQKLANHCQQIAGLSQSPQLIHDHQFATLTSALHALDNAINAPALEICAEELRQARHYISTITGFVGVEELLGRIFSSFCIGK